MPELLKDGPPFSEPEWPTASNLQTRGPNPSTGLRTVLYRRLSRSEFIKNVYTSGPLRRGPCLSSFARQDAIFHFRDASSRRPRAFTSGRGIQRGGRAYPFDLNTRLPHPSRVSKGGKQTKPLTDTYRVGLLLLPAM